MKVFLPIRFDQIFRWNQRRNERNKTIHLCNCQRLENYFVFRHDFYCNWNNVRYTRQCPQFILSCYQRRFQSILVQFHVLGMEFPVLHFYHSSN
jgi:hypothetical protein